MRKQGEKERFYVCRIPESIKANIEQRKLTEGRLGTLNFYILEILIKYAAGRLIEKKD